MENMLKRLFDFQKFEGNEELQSVIDSVHARYATRELDLNEMESVNAAGIPDMDLKKKDQKENRP